VAGDWKVNIGMRHFKSSTTQVYMTTATLLARCTGAASSRCAACLGGIPARRILHIKSLPPHSLPQLLKPKQALISQCPRSLVGGGDGAGCAPGWGCDRSFALWGRRQRWYWEYRHRHRHHHHHHHYSASSGHPSHPLLPPYHEPTLPAIHPPQRPTDRPRFLVLSHQGALSYNNPTQPTTPSLPSGAVYLSSSLAFHAKYTQLFHPSPPGHQQQCPRDESLRLGLLVRSEAPSSPRTGSE